MSERTQRSVFSVSGRTRPAAPSPASLVTPFRTAAPRTSLGRVGAGRPLAFPLASTGHSRRRGANPRRSSMSRSIAFPSLALISLAAACGGSDRSRTSPRPRRCPYGLGDRRSRPGRGAGRHPGLLRGRRVGVQRRPLLRSGAALHRLHRDSSRRIPGATTCSACPPGRRATGRRR